MQPLFEPTFESWRKAARDLLAQKVPPQSICWDQDEPDLFLRTKFELCKLSPEVRATPSGLPAKVPKAFLRLAQTIAWARDKDRWDLLYRILYRLSHDNSRLLEISVDPDILRAHLLFKSVRRDIHKMHAFVRFKKVKGHEMYVAWHKPQHLIIEPAAPFFARRFGDRPWSIFTPDGSAHWDLRQITFGPGMELHEFRVRDEWDDVWKTYYQSIFNPARIKIKAMKLEMSPKYWSSLPEAQLIPELVRAAPARLQTMAHAQNRAAQPPAHFTLAELQSAAAKCEGCPLFRQATQTVFGKGPYNARMMIVGEQPGDEEDLSGEPFVGPAGRLLDQALLEAGLHRDDIYLTNAVKHFKYTAVGKARIHKRPTGSEMHACKPWLEAERERIKPEVVMALGTTAATAILGKLPKIERERGQVLTQMGFAPNIIISWHPAAILRAGNGPAAQQRFAQLVEDLKLMKTLIKTSQQN